jgi:F-type H+-transporting ATPase subunit b
MNMLVSVNPGLIIWTIITFVVLMFLLSKFGWKPIVGALEAREQAIRAAIAEAQSAREEAQQVLLHQTQLIEKAEAEAREILQAARETSEQMRREADVAARTESQRLLDQARREIENAKDAALRDIRDVVADLAVAGASRIVKETLTADKHRTMIDDLVSQLHDSRTN